MPRLEVPPLVLPVGDGDATRPPRDADPPENMARGDTSIQGVSSFQALHNAVSSLYRVDDFVMEKIGSGFFSQVFKVTHKTSNQVMVLKMNVNFNNRPNMLREVQLMNRLSHPNILRFMGVCVNEGQLHALTEYINGGALEELLASEEELPWTLRLKLCTDMAKGMSYLHSRRVIHRDLTSKNILVKKEKVVTAIVGDFGLACKLPDPLIEGDKQLPIVGSPYWMAPECIQGNLYNEKADVFSYGIILCEVIGRVEADPDILPRTRHFGVDYVAFSKMIPELPQEYLGFLHLSLTCCQIDPKKRPSFIETLDSLDELKSRSQMAAVLADINSLQGDTDGIDKAKLDSVQGLGCKRKHSSQSEDIAVPVLEDWVLPKFELLPNLYPPMDADSITPQVMAEFLSQRDEYYTPHRDNPFISRFDNASAKVVGSLQENWAAWFEMPSPSCAITPPATPTTPDENGCRVRPLQLRIRKSHSLPGSPTLNRKEIDRFYESESAPVKRTLSNMATVRRLEEDFVVMDDGFDARSDGSSSTDSAVGLDFMFKDLRSMMLTPRSLQRKYSIEVSSLNSSVDRYRSRVEMFGLRPDLSSLRDDHSPRRVPRGVKERPRSWFGEDMMCSTSSSESCMSAEDAFVMSPSSSYSSYGDLDSELLHLQTTSQLDAFQTRLRSRERFQELVKVWEAKQLTKSLSSTEVEQSLPVTLTPPSFRPRSILSAHKESCDYLERVRKFQEIKHKWELQQQQQLAAQRKKEELLICCDSPSACEVVGSCRASPQTSTPIPLDPSKKKKVPTATLR